MPKTHTSERVSALRLGLRAQWLHTQLNQPAMEIAVPRDRELLTLVATTPTGVARSFLIDAQRRLGTTTPGAAGRWVDALVFSGVLEVSEPDAEDPWIDIPHDVRRQIEARVGELEQT